MAQIDITRTELVWPGKYDENGQRVTPPRVTLPFQTIETINESRASREAKKKPEQTSLFDVWTGDEGTTFEEGWRNKLIWGDNLLVMSSLLEKFAGKIDLIYIDPPFASGLDFSVAAPIGEQDDEAFKEQSVIEEKAYRDTWGRGRHSYLSVMAPILDLIRDLLSPKGTLYLHCDWHVGHYLKALLDEGFGEDQFLNEIIWSYKAGAAGKATFGRKHDTIFRYARDPDAAVFNADSVRIPYAASTLQRLQYAGARERDVQKVLDRGGKVPTDVWDIGIVQGNSAEFQGFPTQKPEELLERIISASSNPGDLVADFFIGSGTTAAVSERLGRRWIGCDLGRYAIHTTRKRLMGIADCRPFEVLNLGRYERQFWQASSFGGRDPQQVLFEYLGFILKLYGAAPVAGMQHIHGKRSGAVVHVGAVDAPVTISEVTEALDECVATGQNELRVLGWEWEMGLNDLVDQLAQERRVRLKLLAIPREVMEAQAVEKGDIRFFELAHLDCRRQVGPGFSLTVELTDFAMSDADAVDPDVRAKITKWSDFVDYWAIDFDFQNDTFMNGWVAYRTRKERRLALQSDSHRYPQAETYHVAVKVVDIFGNDTTRVFAVEVK